MPTYSTADSLRAALDLDEAALTDAKANALLEDAEDVVDRLIGLGGWIDPATGRALRVSTLVVWQRDKLERATNALAAVLHADPAGFQTAQPQNVKGPDFEVSGSVTPRMSAAGQHAIRHAAALLDAASLRRLTARARP